ncbi:hypothetical protein [Motiliproteus sp. MSK22-1]|uniref:hypothetical protein n=1 Tax=Motiliproteus sp. MSK22-1 TaxID=1897630 RepID=UPI0009763C2C|nr:hypothetical protein [Motiliproteus sp. MSK22-1]OMH28380.1 hypothetical protein BGP75_21000 [Motiliproteus sp. MSK22-1]
MNEQAELNDFRLKLYWYAGLLALPVIVIVLLANVDPHKNLRFNEVLELRQQLNAQNVGQEVIAYLDKTGGQNISSEQLEQLRPAQGEELFFMLSSAKYSEKLQEKMKEAYMDGYISQAEADSYQALATVELSSREVMKQFGF